MLKKILFIIGLMIGFPAIAADCGSLKNKEEIQRTEGLIISRAPMVRTIGEFPTREGSAECVRFNFSITPWGTPFSVSISETSGNTAFEISALNALLKYRFRGRLWGFLGGYTLMFSGVDNKMPKNYK